MLCLILNGEHSPIEPATYQDPSTELHVPEPATYMYQELHVRPHPLVTSTPSFTDKKQANDAPTEPATY